MNKKNTDLEVITLSGVQDVGRNCYVVKYREEIVVVDCGIGFSNLNVGIDSLIPDVSWLIKNKKKIKAIVLTHGHADHVSALPYVIEELGFPPIIGSLFTIEFVKELLKKHKLDKRAKFKVVDRNADYQLNKNIKLQFFAVNHSVPYATGVTVRTPAGAAVYTGDFKFDKEPINEPVASTDRIKEIGKQGVDVAMIDSTNVFSKGHSPSEGKVARSLFKIIDKQEGRVIVATFSSMLSRMTALVEIAHQTNRKVVVAGRSISNNLNIAQRIGYLEPPKNIFISPQQMKNYPDNQIMVLATGTQGEPLAALSRLSLGQHQHITLKKNDTIIMAAKAIPGNEIDIVNLQDNLVRHGVNLISKKSMDVHASGHAYREEILKMTDLLKPRFVIPVHGHVSFLAEHKRLLDEHGFPASQVMVPQPGARFGVAMNQLVNFKQIPVKDRYVVHGKVLDVDDSFVQARVTMATGGVVFVVVNDKNQKVIMRGVRSKAQTEEILNELQNAVSQWYAAAKKKASGNPEQKQKKIRNEMYKKVGVYFARRTSDQPLLVVEVG